MDKYDPQQLLKAAVEPRPVSVPYYVIRTAWGTKPTRRGDSGLRRGYVLYRAGSEVSGGERFKLRRVAEEQRDALNEIVSRYPHNFEGGMA